jgi:hypothetical protein
MGIIRMTRIVCAVSITAAFACWEGGSAAAAPDVDILAMFTAAYIRQSRACDVDDWKSVFRETIQKVRKREPKGEFKYMERVVQLATKHEVSTCDRNKLTQSIQWLRGYLDEHFSRTSGECKPPQLNWSLVYCP